MVVNILFPLNISIQVFSEVEKILKTLEKGLKIKLEEIYLRNPILLIIEGVLFTLFVIMKNHKIARVRTNLKVSIFKGTGSIINLSTGWKKCVKKAPLVSAPVINTA